MGKPTVHCIGNGNVFVYGRGADITDASGPEYSSPSAFSVKTNALAETGGSFRSEKLSHIAFRHTLEKGGRSVTVTDLTPEKSSLFLRFAEGSCTFTVTCLNGCFYRTHRDDTLLAVTMPGALIYTYTYKNGVPVGYPSARFRYMVLRVRDNCSIDLTGPDGHGSFTCANITVNGFGGMVFSFAFDLESAFSGQENAGKFISRSFPGIAETACRPKRELTVPHTHPYYIEICDAYDVIAAQQSNGGGVLAGYNYHLSYVRDNYGVFRFLLAAGAYGRARNMLRFYTDVFNRYGRIRNAQGMGEYAFHVHENDSAEITGYLILMFTSYYSATGDRPPLRAGFRLIKYCLEEQHKTFFGGMIPFNGDETYIAGGLLPRSAINDGSAEATMLYYESVRQVCEIDFLRDSLPEKLRNNISRDFLEISRTFPGNFIGADGRLFCNNPDGGFAPLFREGGVLLCGHGFGMSFRNTCGEYVCADCLTGSAACKSNNGNDNGNENKKGKRYVTQAAVLSPAFTGAKALIPPETIRKTAEKVKKELPGRNRTVGYEYGFVIYALGYDRAFAESMLSLRDEFGAFSEYYENGEPAGTLCRPWETAVNIAALIEKCSDIPAPDMLQ